MKLLKFVVEKKSQESNPNYQHADKNVQQSTVEKYYAFCLKLPV